jgi:hypothetical protein
MLDAPISQKNVPNGPAHQSMGMPIANRVVYKCFWVIVCSPNCVASGAIYRKCQTARSSVTSMTFAYRIYWWVRIHPLRTPRKSAEGGPWSYISSHISGHGHEWMQAKTFTRHRRQAWPRSTGSSLREVKKGNVSELELRGFQKVHTGKVACVVRYPLHGIAFSWRCPSLKTLLTEVAWLKSAGLDIRWKSKNSETARRPDSRVS